MKKPKRDHRFFEQWARRNGMKPVTRITDVEIDGEVVGDILIADSEDMLWRSSYPNDEHNLICFWRTGYAIDRGDKSWIAAFCDYDMDAFSEYDGDSKRDQRVKDAVKAGVQAMEATYRAGLYNGNDRRPELH